jgi:hypothetical protein
VKSPEVNKSSLLSANNNDELSTDNDASAIGVHHRNRLDSQQP